MNVAMILEQGSYVLFGLVVILGAVALMVVLPGLIMKVTEDKR